MENVVQSVVHEVKKIPQLESNLHKVGNDISKIAKLEFEVTKVARDMQNVHQQQKNDIVRGGGGTCPSEGLFESREGASGACNGGINENKDPILPSNPIPTTIPRIFHAK